MFFRSQEEKKRESSKEGISKSKQTSKITTTTTTNQATKCLVLLHQQPTHQSVYPIPPHPLLPTPNHTTPLPPSKRKGKEKKKLHDKKKTPIFPSLSSERDRQHRHASTILQIIRRHKPTTAIFPNDLGLPPPIVLQAEDGEDVAFREGEFLGDLRVVEVHGARCN